MSTPESNLEIACRYLTAIEQGATGDALAAFYTPDVVQEEFPNRLAPNGARRGLDGLLEGAERGQALLSAQTYEVTNAVADGDRVAMEVLWTGTLAAPLGTLTAGSTMRAHIAMFLDFRDGKIARQRNYDCYEPS
jgi:ketosteroid isomerase-like protein